jgi:uncharacterized membrane protein
MKETGQANQRCTTGLADRSPLVFGILLAAVLCSGALLRFYRLDAQSFWNDEGNSARIAERSLDLIVEGAAGDIHPPGYYLLLHAWRGLFGDSEFALRSLSVVAGEALVVLTCLVGRRLFGRSVGLLAAALSALSPFAIYYSQEARMYALLGALAAGSIYVALRMMDRIEARSQGEERGLPFWLLASYVLVNAAGLYTHYAFTFVIVAHNVAFGVRWLIRSLRGEAGPDSLLAWVGVHLGVGLLYLPWASTALGAAGWSSARGADRLGPALLDVARVLTVGRTQPLAEAVAAVAAAILLLSLGLWPGLQAGRWSGGGRRARRGDRTDTLSLLIYLAVPLGLFFGLDLYKPAWLKFLIVLLPSFHVLIARGIGNAAALAAGAGGRLGLQRWTEEPIVSAILLMGIAALTVPSLGNLYFDPAYARDDYRQLATDVEAMRRAGDGIVLNAPNQWEVFTYYYPDRDVHPAPYRPGPEEAASFLESLLDEYDRLFVITWGDAESDSEKRIESWLAGHAYKAGARWYGDVRLATYGVAPLPEEPRTEVEAVFGDRLLLHGHALAAGGPLLPGHIAPVTLFWEALGPVMEPYKVTVQMLDEDGRLVSQVDTIPGDGLAPVATWETDEVFVDRYGVPVPQDALPGRYTLIVAVYHAFNGQRLTVEREGEPAGDTLLVAEVSVRSGE